MDERQVHRARLLRQQIERAERQAKRLRAQRDDLVQVMRQDGASQREVARVLGLTPGRVAQLDLERGTKRGVIFEWPNEGAFQETHTRA